MQSIKRSNIYPYLRVFTFINFFIFIALFTKGQDTLPNISVVNSNNNILITWSNPFTSLTTINIQRSLDSLKNFTTIGTVLNVKNLRNGYVDLQPRSTDFFYRLFLSFEGGTYIFTKSYRPVIDTSVIIPASLQVTEVNTGFIPSKLVFTSKFNNVILNLPEAEMKKYHIKFFDENYKFLFEINKIKEPYLILEKVNFMHSGLFNYELYDDNKIVERYKFYIGKDPKLNSSTSDPFK